jgi:hypothetical protein
MIGSPSSNASSISQRTNLWRYFVLSPTITTSASDCHALLQNVFNVILILGPPGHGIQIVCVLKIEVDALVGFPALHIAVCPLVFVPIERDVNRPHRYVPPLSFGFSTLLGSYSCLVIHFASVESSASSLSLSEIKSEHSDGVIRRELVSGECARRLEQPAAAAHGLVAAMLASRDFKGIRRTSLGCWFGPVEHDCILLAAHWQASQVGSSMEQAAGADGIICSGAVASGVGATALSLPSVQIDPCTVVVEACTGAFYWARKFEALAEPSRL